jgi:hypothetical protein
MTNDEAVARLPNAEAVARLPQAGVWHCYVHKLRAWMAGGDGVPVRPYLMLVISTEAGSPRQPCVLLRTFLAIPGIEKRRRFYPLVLEGCDGTEPSHLRRLASGRYSIWEQSCSSRRRCRRGVVTQKDRNGDPQRDATSLS